MVGMETDYESLGRKALTDLLRNAGYKPSHVSRIVNGKATPSLDLALKIEEATGIPPGFWKSNNRGAAMWARIQQESKT